MSHEVEERRLKMLIEQYVEVRKKRHDIVSVRQAAVAVLTVMKACPVSRRELDDMIAASAVAHGLGVAFDVQQYPSQFSISH
jgi:predicted RecB family endonuclease